MFDDDIVISEITHASIVAYKENEISIMNDRPWHGLAFSLCGELIYYNQTDKIRLNETNIVFLPKNVTYKIKCIREGKFAFVNFKAVSEIRQTGIISVKENTELFKKEFGMLRNAFNGNSSDKNYISFSHLYAMLSMLLSGSIKSSMPAVLNDALHYIDENIASLQLCNSNVASAEGISEVYLRKMFVKYLSVSTGAYIQNRRIDLAKSFLNSTTMAVSEIAEKCGYSNVYYFSKLFKSKCGCSPTQYRKNNSRSLF